MRARFAVIASPLPICDLLLINAAVRLPVGARLAGTIALSISGAISVPLGVNTPGTIAVSRNLAAIEPVPPNDAPTNCSGIAFADIAPASAKVPRIDGDGV
jgi:hypothetical protein